MLTTAALLGVLGLLLIVLSAAGLRNPKSDPYIHAGICEAPSPDDSLRCTEELGHYGWHKNGTTAWFGSAWECDEWAETQQATIVELEPTIAAAEWNPRKTDRPTEAANIIGPKPLKFQTGIFGTRRPIQ